MSRSLQEQLLALGLATEAQLPAATPKHKPGPKKRKKSRPPRGRKSPGGPPPQRERAAAGSRRNLDEPTAAERALRQRVHKLIVDQHEARGEDAQIPFHFVKGSRVKRIYVTEDQQRRLSANELAVAAMKGRHYVIPIATAREIRELIPPYFVSMGEDESTLDLSDVDDEYSDFQVPDDLTW